MKGKHRSKNILTLGLLCLIAVLIISGLRLEHQDKRDSPLHRYYVETYEDAGSINLVETILLNYRAYDTFGEVMVLYIAIAGILILGEDKKKGDVT